MSWRRVKKLRKYVRGVPTDEYKYEGYYDSTLYPDEDKCLGEEWRPVEGQYWCEMVYGSGGADSNGSTYTQRMDSIHDCYIGWHSREGKVYRMLGNYGTYGFDVLDEATLTWSEVSRYSRPSDGYAKQLYCIGYIDETARTAAFVNGTNLVVMDIDTGSTVSVTSITGTQTGVLYVNSNNELIMFRPGSGSAASASIMMGTWDNGYGSQPVETKMTCPDGRAAIGSAPTFDTKSGLCYVGTVTQTGMSSDAKPTYDGFGDIWEFNPDTKAFSPSKVSLPVTQFDKVVSNNGTVEEIGYTLYVAGASSTSSYRPLMVHGGKFIWLNGYNSAASSSSAKNVMTYMILHDDGSITRQQKCPGWFSGSLTNYTVAVNANASIRYNGGYLSLYKANA